MTDHNQNAALRRNAYLAVSEPMDAFAACIKDVVSSTNADPAEVLADAERLLGNAGGDYEKALDYLCFYLEVRK